MRSGFFGSYARARTSPPSGPTGAHCAKAGIANATRSTKPTILNVVETFTTRFPFRHSEGMYLDSEGMPQGATLEGREQGYQRTSRPTFRDASRSVLMRIPR